MLTLKSILSAMISAILLFFSSFGAVFDCSTPAKPETGYSSPEWRQMVLDNYNEFISEVDGNGSRIPIIVSTDQHGAISADSKFYEYIDSIVDWDRISAILNLGDTVELTFNESELKDYAAATKCLPADKRIETIGNHDRILLTKKEGATIRDRYFNSLNSPNAEYSPDGSIFVVKDSQFGVRYLGIDLKEPGWMYEDGVLRSAQADYIIGVLSADDPSDILLVSHPYLFRDAMLRRDGSGFTGSEYFIGGPKKYADVKQSFVDMLAARKTGGSGVLLDCDGGRHPYDFSACEGELLMTLHGHHHTEGYETKDGITEFLFQGMNKDNEDDDEPDCFYFAYIDTETKTFKCWKNVFGYEAWEINIA